MNHLRANLYLLASTIVICSVLYPAFLLLVGQTMFPNQAQGSLVGKDGKPADGKNAVGSKLIGQPFAGDEFFQPRQSAVGYQSFAKEAAPTATASSGATNWGAANYLLRDRVARQLGPIVKYGKAERTGKPGGLVGPDVEKWFQQDKYQGNPGILAQWAGMHSGLAENWIKGTADAVKGQWKEGDDEPSQADAFLKQWAQDMPELHKTWIESEDYAKWKKENPEATPSTGDLAGAFLPAFSKAYPGEWPTLEEYEAKDKEKRKKLVRTKESSEIQSTFFEMWRQDHPKADLELVPADMVTASGSGLDPHITLKNAQYQLDRVAAKWAEKTKRDAGAIRTDVETILREHSESPLGGLAGTPALVNVLDVNIALQKKFGS